MNQNSAIEAFASLAHPSRMTIFRQLVRRGPEGMVAGDIARSLNIVPSTLSGHLAVLRRAGLLSAARKQREIHYSANLAAINDLVAFLLADCCEGTVENCSDILSLLKSA